jgi:hypothetical protein
VKFIQVKFGGGLGNQLFQYATARALMKKGDVLLLNSNGYSKDYLQRKFSLLNFNIRGSVLEAPLIRKLFTPRTKLNRLADRLGLFSFINEQSFFIHHDLIHQCKTFTTILGYWQSETYFYSIREQLLKELEPISVPMLPNFTQRKDTVAVHVRRTDYLEDERYGFLGEAYYTNAINLVKKKVADPVFIFFSDDVQWCKETFKQESIQYCEDPNWKEDYLQLYLMSKCSHQIIANSSFSWWGAWLNTKEDKIVIRPENPFKDKSLFYENYYPSNWLAI